jgi:hypothetical protein
MQKKQYTAAFKAQVVHADAVAARGDLRGPSDSDRRLEGGCAQRAVGPLRDGTLEFAAEKAAHEKEVSDLYARVGRLTMQVACLEKKAGIQK